MLDILRRRRNQDSGYKRSHIPDWMGYPRSDYSRYDPYGEENWNPERKSIHALEGAGRRGWDYDQNRGYGQVYGNSSPSDRNHRGKGPRNYVRSDERIREDIHERLGADWRIDAGDVEVEVSNGVVKLGGNVKDKSTRRRIEDVSESVNGVREVENRIRVVK